MNPDGTWSALPVPDLHDDNVENEDNLIRLIPQLSPLLNEGVVELEILSGAEKIQLWTDDTKGTEITLEESKKTWDLSDIDNRTEFKNLSKNEKGIWIEGIEASGKERDVVMVLRYRNTSGQEVDKDTVKATVVMINLGNAVYRDNHIWSQSERGHSAIVWHFTGPTTKKDLFDNEHFLITEMCGPTFDRDLTTITNDPGHPAKGCYTNPSITYIQRLRILQTAKAFKGHTLGYPDFGANAIEPLTGDVNTWNGGLDTIGSLRCDAYIEVLYEMNGVEVWGMVRVPDNNIPHFDITDQTDEWDYNSVLGKWYNQSNGEMDTQEEHNDFDVVGWTDTLMPATQAGYSIPQDAKTRFVIQNLCIPTGSTGGN